MSKAASVIVVRAYTLHDLLQTVANKMAEGYKIVNTATAAPRKLGSSFQAVLAQGVDLPEVGALQVEIRETSPAVYNLQVSADAPGDEVPEVIPAATSETTETSVIEEAGKPVEDAGNGSESPAPEQTSTTQSEGAPNASQEGQGGSQEQSSPPSQGAPANGQQQGKRGGKRNNS